MKAAKIELTVLYDLYWSISAPSTAGPMNSLQMYMN